MCTYSIIIHIASNKAIIKPFIRFSSVCHVSNSLALNNITQEQLKYIGLFSITIVFISLHDSVANDKSILIFMCMIHSFGGYYTQYQIHNNLIFRTENQHEGLHGMRPNCITYAWFRFMPIKLNSTLARVQDEIRFFFITDWYLLPCLSKSVVWWDMIEVFTADTTEVPTKVKHSAHIHMCNLSV